MTLHNLEQSVLESQRPPHDRERLFRIASSSPTNTGNPYIDLFYQALQANGIQLTGRMKVDLDWLKQQNGQVDAIHVHWPENLWRGRPRGRLDRIKRSLSAGTLRGVVRLKRFLQQTKQIGIKCIWTVHNLEHHEGVNSIDRWGYRTLAEHSDLLICHSHCAAEQVRQRYRIRGQVVVMPHGNYAGVFPTPRSRKIVRDEFGLSDDRTVVSCVGTLRRYKGAEIVAEAARIAGENFQFVVAGGPRPANDAGYWQDLSSRAPGVIVHPEKLSDQQYSDLIAASDAVLLPYKKITGSGALLAAWSLGVGVVCSDLPFFREMLTSHTGAGALFKSGSAIDLVRSIKEFTKIPTGERVAAVNHACEANAWSNCIRPVVDVIKLWREESIV